MSIKALRFGLLVVLCAGCGGGSDDSSETNLGVARFPDVIEIARSEFPDNAPLLDVKVSADEISIVHVRFGRVTRYKYNPNGTATGNEPITGPVDLDRTFSIADVPTGAPAAILAAIESREGGDASNFSATLTRTKNGALVWDVRATVEGEPSRYSADLDGSLRDG